MRQPWVDDTSTDHKLALALAAAGDDSPTVHQGSQQVTLLRALLYSSSSDHVLV